MSKFCGDCGTQLANGSCSSCANKSVSELGLESLEKALTDLESVAKGVRPSEAPAPKVDVRDLEQVTEQARKQVREYGDHGEGDSEEEPETEKDVESRVKGKGSTKKVFGKGGFMPPPPQGQDEEDPEEEERRREEEEAEERPMPFKSAKGKAKKSMADDLMENDNVRKAVDVSPFLEGLTTKIIDSYDSLQDDVNKSLAGWSYQQKYNVGLAKALGELGSLVKGLTDVVNALSKTPVGTRKGDVSVVEKSFAGNGEAAPDGQTLNKGAIAQKILALKESGDTSITDMDVLRAESTGLVTPEIQKKLGL